MKNMCIILGLFISSCSYSQKNEEHKFTNNLINETSPYLLQHAHNPVNWYAWGDEALAKAKKENKLLLISIGYAACHWCHVMEHECFEDEQVAKYMNDNFICIKVDREERPDIDMVYMNAVQLLSGSGGWPLNCIALPDGKPFYGGTYFPKDKWLNMLKGVRDFVRKNPQEAAEQADLLTKGIASSERIVSNASISKFSENDLDVIFTNWEKNIDFKRGGRQGAPKFPMPASYNFMMHYANPSADDAIRTGLMAMAYGGIYDQLRGGFARYSTDALWKVPHFEKMLYDNAQLISVYANAYQKTKNVEYKNVVIESLEFIEAEMTSPEGGFYSSLDADSDGEEGTFYIWGQKEINDLLGDKADIISEFYNVNNKGNWEHGKNILLRKHSVEEFCEKNKIDSRKFNKDLELSKSILLKHRNKRNRPATDDKILCSWNALMIKAYVDAYLVIDEAKYKDRAISSAKFLSDKFLSKDYSLKRNYKNGKSSIDAFLDDYAFTIDAFISLYQLDFDQKYLDEALSISRYVIKHFYDKDSGMFFYTSNVGARLIARKMEISDNVIPASNSQMAINLFKLSEYFYEDEFRYMSEKMLSNVIENTKTGGVYYANWDVLLSYFVHGVYNVAILGKKTDKLRKEFQENYLPFVLLSGSNKEDDVAIHEGKYIKNKTLIYVCKNKTCDYPVSKVSEALLQIKK